MSRSVETAAKQLNKRSIVSLSTMGNYSGSRGDIQKQQRPPKRQRQRRLNLNFEVSKGGRGEEEKERTNERKKKKKEKKKTAIKEKSERMLHRSDSCPFEGGEEAKEGGSGEGRKYPNISARASACRLSLLSAKK